MELILRKSRATEPFKLDVTAFCSGRMAPRVSVEGFAPRVKVQRLLMQLLASEPGLPITRVVVRGRSGCSDFTGEVKVETISETRVFDFVWDCRWRAEMEGWTDCFGLPDQTRAAQEFDWQCFQVWAPRSAVEELAEAGDIETRA
ncbi:MAG: hypothetical protein ABR499_02255 [Gemmatimonadaceae bacterium]